MSFEEGDLHYLHYVSQEDHWWTVRAWLDATGDPRTASSCFGTSLLSTIGAWNASIGPFQAVRKWAFDAVGGYDTDHPLEDLNLSRKLHERGLQLHRIPLLGILHRPFTRYPDIFAKFEAQGVDRFGPHPVRRWVPSSTLHLRAEPPRTVASKRAVLPSQ